MEHIGNKTPELVESVDVLKKSVPIQINHNIRTYQPPNVVVVPPPR